MKVEVCEVEGETRLKEKKGKMETAKGKGTGRGKKGVGSGWASEESFSGWVGSLQELGEGATELSKVEWSTRYRESYLAGEDESRKPRTRL